MLKEKIRVLCAVCLCVVFFLCGCTSEKADVALENPGVKVTFFDVGKGDAILIETISHTFLIDSGYDSTAGIILDYFEKQNIQRLDYLLLTHFDKDHVGGADQILEKVNVEEIMQPDYESDSKQYLEYKDAAEKKSMQPVSVTETIRFSLDGADFLIYPPKQEKYEEEDNDFSLVISMIYKNKSFLFTGDCEKERLNELLEQTEFDLSHDVLKVPHHGKKEKNSEDFIKAVSPKAAVITCSQEAPVSDGIYNILNEFGIETYMTSDGTITCLCDGDTVKFVV